MATVLFAIAKSTNATIDAIPIFARLSVVIRVAILLTINSIPPCFFYHQRQASGKKKYQKYIRHFGEALVDQFGEFNKGIPS